jgi:hypothetical protein
MPDTSRDRYAYQPRNVYPPREPQPRAESTPDMSRDRYAYQRRNVYPPREPQPRAERNYERDRYAYQPQNPYPPPRRGYGYYGDPRSGRYGYDPRYGYYGDPRSDRDPRTYDRRYRY